MQKPRRRWFYVEIVFRVSGLSSIRCQDESVPVRKRCEIMKSSLPMKKKGKNGGVPESSKVEGGRSAFGIALGGGGSRAFIHFGVLSKLEEVGLRPSQLTGSSMGAVLGALYASEPNFNAALPRLLDYFRKSSLFGGLIKPEKGDGLHSRPGILGNLARKFATWSVATAVSFRQGLRRQNPVNKAIWDFFGREGKQYEQLHLPFGTNALNLTTGNLEEFVSGSIGPPLRAGVAIGLIFAPFLWNDHQYADAAPICPVPVNLCRRLGAQKILAVDICAPLRRPLESRSGFDVVQRILSMQSELLNKQETNAADLILDIDVSDVFWGDFSRIDELVERGRTAADSIVDRLREVIGGSA